MGQAWSSVFWDDLGRDLKDPDLLRTYIVTSACIATIDCIMGQIDDARVAAGLSKAALARAVDSHPDTMRRLFTAGHVRRHLGTLVVVAAVLGLQMTLEPLDETEWAAASVPLMPPEHAEAAALVRRTDIGSPVISTSDSRGDASDPDACDLLRGPR